VKTSKQIVHVLAIITR